MTRGILADAGPLYAALDPHDAHHRRATEELRELVSERRDILITFPTLLETYSLVLFSLGIKIAASWLTEMADATLVNPTSEDYRLAFARLRSLPDQRITLFDAVTASVATRLGVPVWTYDHHFDVMRVGVWR
jgi:predicted nucleic acid-binding protein